MALLLLLAFDLHAQRLDITDVNSKSPNEPGFDLRLALGGTVNTDMTVSTRDGRSYPQQNINPLILIFWLLLRLQNLHVAPILYFLVAVVS